MWQMEIILDNTDLRKCQVFSLHGSDFFKQTFFFFFFCRTTGNSEDNPGNHGGLPRGSGIFHEPGRTGGSF